MGFKLLQRAYKIKHIVCVCNEKRYGGEVICIGSPYIHDIIVIDMQGEVIKRYKGDGHNEELTRYQSEFDADAEKLKRIVTTPDAFDAFETHTVYICEDGHIREELCEEYGWPNTTTKGELMYENTSFKTYKDAYQYALDSTAYDRYRRLDERERIAEAAERFFKAVRWIIERRTTWLYVRTILWIKKFYKD